uniref:Uncharacterized protein n=1 Tax=Arundo donax TaxID=35708 RepID=A0A0A9BYI0_ARUDO
MVCQKPSYQIEAHSLSLAFGSSCRLRWAPS